MQTFQKVAENFILEKSLSELVSVNTLIVTKPLRLSYFHVFIMIWW